MAVGFMKIQPILTATLSPSFPKVGEPVSVRASATDQAGVSWINIRIDSNSQTCQSTTCFMSATLPLGTHTYSVTERDNKGVSVQLPDTSFTVSATPTINPLVALYDYNNDGKVDKADAQFLLQVAVGVASCPSGKTCDINNNGVVNSVDSVLLLRIITTSGSNGVISRADNRNQTASAQNAFTELTSRFLIPILKQAFSVFGITIYK